MCEVCCEVCRGRSRDDVDRDTVRSIERYGWAVQAVGGDRLHPPWAYTVGLHLYGQPELVVTGMTARRAHALLNERAEHHVRHTGEPPVPGTGMSLRDGPMIEFVELPHPDAHLFTAVRLLGPGVRAVQIVWADDRGRWPWERGFRGRRGGQPVLGPRGSR